MVLIVTLEEKLKFVLAYIDTLILETKFKVVEAKPSLVCLINDGKSVEKIEIRLL